MILSPANPFRNYLLFPISNSMVGMNITYEEDIGYGKFLNTGYDFVTHGIPEGYCAITAAMAEDWEIYVGDTLKLYWWEMDRSGK